MSTIAHHYITSEFYICASIHFIFEVVGRFLRNVIQNRTIEGAPTP